MDSDKTHVVEENKIQLDKPSLVLVRRWSAESSDTPSLGPCSSFANNTDADERNEVQFGKPSTAVEDPESDSDATVPEPSSPQFATEMPSLAQSRDLPLCKILNISREDRSFSHARTHVRSHHWSFSHLLFIPVAVSFRFVSMSSIAAVIVSTGTSTPWTATSGNGTSRPH